jgi:hypothetical protein
MSLAGSRTRPAISGDIRLPKWLPRYARLVILALVVGVGIGHLYWSAVGWHMADAGAYWQAALRLREGAGLYPAVSNVEASEVYRYAPWFAWMTVPFTFLPIQVAGAIWSALLIAASCVAVLPLVRGRHYLAAAFFWPILIGISASGNVHALMIAALVLGVECRSGPLWIAMAASLKAVPILLVVVYVARREWVRAGMTLVLTVLLVAPMLLYDLSAYPSSPGQAGLLISWPILYVAAIGAAVLATVLMANRPYAWLAAATAVAVALPRFFVYDVTFILVGTAGLRGQRSASSR